MPPAARVLFFNHLREAQQTMFILALIQVIFAAGFLLVGVVALFGIGITGLLFLAPGAVFAVTAGVAQDQSRAATALALALDAVLAWLAVRKLDVLLTPGAPERPDFLDYAFPCAVLVLVGVGALAVAMDWRALKRAPWF